jgi:hypothetical protein
MAELMETPIMLVVTIAAGWWIVRRLAVPWTPSHLLGMGCLALGLLLVAEFTLVLWLRGLSISEYLAAPDPASRTVYYVILEVFALMPLLAARRSDGAGLRCQRRCGSANPAQDASGAFRNDPTLFCSENVRRRKSGGKGDGRHI